jgi:hypothetical protein
VSPDPLLHENVEGIAGDPGKLSLYAYAALNPLLFIDPDGKDIFLFTWSPGEVGHAYGHTAVGVTEYKPGTNEPTGYVRVYSFRPAGGNLNALPSPNERRWGSVQTARVKVDDIGKFKDVNDAMGRPADGIVKLKTNYYRDDAFKSRIENKHAKLRAEGKLQYDPVNLNCADFCDPGLLGADGDQIKEDVFGYDVTTPNALHREVAKQKNAEVIRNPGDRGRRMMEDAIRDDDSKK